MIHCSFKPSFSFVAGALLLCVGVLLAGVAQAKKTMPRSHDEHSYSEPDKVRIVDMGLNLRVDFDRKQIRGSVDLALDWKDKKHRELVLDTRDLTIVKVLAKSGDSGWYRQQYELGKRDPIFGSKLTIKLKKQHDVVRIRYATSPDASGLQWLAPSMTQGGKLPFMFSQSQAVHARSWVPLQDTPSVRYTYSAVVRTKPQVMVLMSADNPVQARRDGLYTFRMRQPIPSYLMAIAAGDLVFKPISERAGVWAEPATVDKAVAEFIDTERMIQATEKLYGAYRWERYDLLILPPSFPFGGMENPRLSFITPTVIVGDKSLTSLIAHELAHSWSGNLVTNASWKDIWLNEGFTSYVENRIVEAVYGKTQADMENVIGQFGLKHEMKQIKKRHQVLALPALDGIDPDEALTDVAYVKGQWFLMWLEQAFGRATFDEWLRGYFDRHAFQSITSDTFMADINKHLVAKHPDKVTQKQLNTWLYQPGIPRFANPATSALFDQVDAERGRWLNGDVAAKEMAHQSWGTQAWIRFLEGLPQTLRAEQLAELDEAFKFTGTPNGEYAERWYPLTVRSQYFEALPSMRSFLVGVGRRKLIMPTYEALLIGNKEQRDFAKQSFEAAKPSYHPITTHSIQSLIDKTE